MGKFSGLYKRLGAAFKGFDAGKSGRRLRGFPTAQFDVNAKIRTYGSTILSRSRNLCNNNVHASSAREVFVTALIGTGIKPASLVQDPKIKERIDLVHSEWALEADADNLTDLYGMQCIVAGELFEAGEVFYRFRDRRPADGLIVPLQIQLIPAEMVPLSKNEDLGGGRYIQMGIEFDAIGRRVAYHVLTKNPTFGGQSSQTKRITADQMKHVFRPLRAGQIRGLPHSLSAIVRCAILDSYEDAEIERKRTSSLFALFITTPEKDSVHALEGTDAVETDVVDDSFGLEPGIAVSLNPGEDIKTANPADVGANYEPFIYRQLLATAAGFGVPYANMTGDLRSTSYGSIRAGLIDFRRRIGVIQNTVIIAQFCRPIWKRYFPESVLAGALGPVLSYFTYLTDRLGFSRVKFSPPKWEWIDPLHDRKAEKIAVDSGWKSRSDVIEAEGFDPVETDKRIQLDRERAEAAGNVFDDPAGQAAAKEKAAEGEAPPGGVEDEETQD